MLLWIRATIRISRWIFTAPIQTMFRFSHWRIWFLFCFSRSKIESGGCLVFRICVLAYIFSPHCSSSFCVSVHELFRLRLFIVVWIEWNIIIYSHLKLNLCEIPIKQNKLKCILNSPQIKPNADWIHFYLVLIARVRENKR